MSGIRSIVRTAGFGLIATAIGMTAAAAAATSGSPAKAKAGRSHKVEYAMIIPHGAMRLACRILRLKHHATVRITNRDAFWIEAGRTIVWHTTEGAAGVYKLRFALHPGKSIRLPVKGEPGKCAALLR